MQLIKAHIWLLLLIISVGIFASPFLFFSKVPIPQDALIGLYHPWRDALRNEYPNGYPFKNPLITDPVRQQFVYRTLAIAQLKKGTIPKWDPYSFAGTPLLANIQTATFYPLNIVFWIVNNQVIAWSILVLLQPLLASVFTYLYLRNLKLSPPAAFLGGISFAFSGFMVAWMEWNTIAHVALWLPLALLCKDKLVNKFSLRWAILLIIAEANAFLAGHLQTAMYFFIFINIYLAVRIWQKTKGNLQLMVVEWIPFLIKGLVIFILISPQLLPTIQFTLQSARQFDLPDWHRPDWFLPWVHLMQLVVPDFFGNPATGNYWGVWNYGEFVSYIGIFPLMMALFAMFFRRDKKTLFFTAGLIGAFIFALPTWFAQIPYVLQIPFLSTLQPSRIIFIVGFCLAILGALGLDHLLNSKIVSRRIFNYFLTGFGIIFVSMWLVVFLAQPLGKTQEVVFDLLVSKRNLILPTLFWVMAAFGVILVKKRRFNKLIVTLLLLVTTIDLLHFSDKFLPFVSIPKDSAETFNFLEEHAGFNRIMTTDRRILPPNTAAYFHLQSVDGYDPLYLKSYGEVVAAWTRNRPDIRPAAFNRILTPEKTDSFFTDLLGVKYILSLKDEDSSKLKLIFQEGETRVYENTRAFPRAFFVSEVSQVKNTQELFNQLFDHQHELNKIAFTTSGLYVKPTPITPEETVQIESYAENEVRIQTNTNQERLLVLTDIYYPEWKVFINGFKSSIFPVDHIFRGVVVPKGESTVTFKI